MLLLLHRVRLCLFVLPFLFAACVPQRNLPYFQGKYNTSTAVLAANTPQPYRIQPNDVLSVRVQSVQPALNEIFNVTDARAVFQGDPGNMFLAGYNVDATGHINLPTVGKVKVQGLTIEETQAQIQRGVANYVRDANVLVKLLSFKITVLGEVRNPGRHFVYNGQATVLEALGLAGDLTEFGNRRNIKLIRTTPKGNEVLLLDLTDPKLLSSPNFFLLPNDALYVEPLAARTNRANVANLALVFSGISALALILNYINAN
ncbi:polysaccharide biosynthesis/export family protein [Hymenobacter latericus]|uniref:polysaccharide biosynthesis/export family protein n=1 Tax=Hymenobacter sp. YIM 151858-1 TaxID=2987688 RepID=UPI002226124E|nr:polysaccharide biosynthesis/export family protein [Hymenobacter sp. YIM 151858-1]UYZ60793.1 polysaccharide export protein [Hymenobacter sp. YIM 151858-1]